MMFSPGQVFLVTQGLTGCTLVDKKKRLFRLFVSPFNLARTTAVFARIKYTVCISAESVFYALREVGIKEVYAPIEGKPLGFVASPGRVNNNRCDLDGVSAFA
jgi:hypothetical protein